MNLTWEIIESAGLKIYQPTTGHRYGEESLALATFINVKPGQRVVELGSGVGIISLLIAVQNNPSRIDAVELQPSLHEIAKKNVLKNGYEHIVHCINEDYRSFAQTNKKKYDVVISNPPFLAAGNGRLSPDLERATARHELNGTIEDLVAATYSLLLPSGKFFVVFDCRRNDELEHAASKVGFKESQIKTCDGSVFVLGEFKKVLNPISNISLLSR
ncbi:MAG: methyltransferase [Pseudomonadota bacterium]